MTLTLEINESPVCEMEVENNREVYAAATAWQMLLKRTGMTNYSIYKTFSSDADNQQPEGANNGDAGADIIAGSCKTVAKIPKVLEISKPPHHRELSAERKAV